VTNGRPAVLLLGDTLNLGGTERQFVFVARGIDKTLWDVHLACLRAEGPLRSELEGAALHAWSCGHGSLKPHRSLRTILKLAGYLRRHHIDLVHSFDFYSNMVGIPAARLVGAAVIASQRNLGNLRPRLQQWLHERMLRRATGVLVNSKAILTRLRSIPEDRIVVIPNGIDTTRFRPPRDPRPAVSAFGTVANLRPAKGLDDLIHATALVRTWHPHVRVLVWGEGDARPALEALIDRLGLRGTVELRGATGDVPAALRECHAFVLPSRSEGCSNALLEAMACGLPVIASDAGGNIEIVAEGRAGLLVPSGDRGALADAMIQLIEDPALAERLAIQDAERVRTDFSIDRMMEGVQAAYHRTLGPRYA
jgi:glycosyltransferase involved in cell wall biosynthesis